MKMLGHKGLSTECPLIFIIQNAGLESSISENNVPELATLPKIKSKLPYGFFFVLIPYIYFSLLTL